MENTEKNYTSGIVITRNPNAPSFVIANVGINVKDFTEWLNQNKDQRGWVNVDFKQAMSGKFYAEKNSWKPSENNQPVQASQNGQADDDDLPF